MFLTGFIFASVIVYLICIQEKLLPSYANAGIGFCAGVLFGLITMLVQYVGLFVTGFHTGLFVALATLALIDQFVQPQTLLVTMGSLLGCLTIFGTSLYGGALISGSVDYLLEGLRSAKWLWRHWGRSLPCYPVLALWPAMLIVGLAVQIFFTAPPTHNTCKHGVRARTREQRAELRQNKYRYLYQVRTAHGDVISQNYVQALQNKVVGPGETSTLESDATHLTMLPDGQPDLNRPSAVSFYR
ncbi:hypothetical protein AAG570_004903 [Ranatra chinensis]|uniref:Transmembrane protein 198 n=1 Tax=Ranatra chinensis TaxID=642074 RepID=A0ABD0YKM9_9HEMI